MSSIDRRCLPTKISVAFPTTKFKKEWIYWVHKFTEVTEEVANEYPRTKKIRILSSPAIKLSYVHNNHNVLQAVVPDCFLLEELLTTLLFCPTLFGQRVEVILNNQQEI